MNTCGKQVNGQNKKQGHYNPKKAMYNKGKNKYSKDLIWDLLKKRYKNSQ